MFKEILQIIPKLAPNDLNNMERSLTTRFGRIAKKFGKGLAASLAGGGLAGMALGLVDKLLNPLKETQEAIDRTLKSADDLVTNAKQFGTTSGKLARLRAIGASTGLDAGNLDVLITKFQVAVAEAAADPTKQTSVRNFVGDKDSAESFFEFIQSLRKMTTEQQLLVQKEVFGEKQILKVADFLQSAGDVATRLGGPTAEQLTPVLDRSASLNDMKEELAAKRDLTDQFTKGSLITGAMIQSQDRRAEFDQARENKQIQSYLDLQSLSLNTAELLGIGKDILLRVAGWSGKLDKIMVQADKMMAAPIFKGIIKYMPGGK